MKYLEQSEHFSSLKMQFLKNAYFSNSNKIVIKYQKNHNLILKFFLQYFSEFEEVILSSLIYFRYWK